MQLRRFLDALTRLLTSEFELFVSLVVLILAVLLGFLVRRYVIRLLVSLDVPDTVEGTAFDRAARRLGTSTVGLLALVSGVFVVVVGSILALRGVGALPQELLTQRIASFIKEAFIAIIVLIVGVITGDKAELYVREKLRGVKVPEISALPPLVKYSVFYVAAVIALGQLGVAISALLVLLGAYAFGVFFIGGLAFKDLLSAAAAGTYLLLVEPYSIGDEIEIDDRRGVVQEVDVFVTRIEREGEEFIVPNDRAFRNGIVRVRE